jgi:hypothetical protein
MIVATLGAHVATEAGPDGVIPRCAAALPQPSLCYETGVEVWVVLGNWTYHGALAAVKAQVYLGVGYFSFRIEQLLVMSSLREQSSYLVLWCLG